MTLIDLGELRDVEHPESSARPRRVALRMPVFLAVLLAALATLAASTPLPVRDVVVVPSRLGADQIVAGGLLMVVDPADRRGGPRSMTAYRLSGGDPVWRVPLPASGTFWGGHAQAGLLLVTGFDPESYESETVALDPRTGTSRWRQPGRAVPVAGGGLLLEALGEDGSGAVRAVDPCCGTLRWRARVSAGGPTYGATGTLVDRVVLGDPRGRVEVRAAGTGAVLATADLGSAEGSPSRQWSVVADVLVSVDGARVTAYGLDRLDRRWTATVPAAMYAMDCGVFVCVHVQPGSLSALDATTGRLLWTRTDLNPLLAEPDGLIVTGVTSATTLMDLALLDPVTGETRAELGRWELAPRWSGDEPLLAVRPHPARGAVVAEVDLVAATVRILDVLPEAAGGCQAVDGGLVCLRHDGSLGLWRLRR
ncbi:PQQ-binding-like beta-propeller repeat protein [Micromonospora sp. WMMC415]|uniref:outer membrane protein assembly factor BamB family protein n=1 Tax=Micromonospora sp. WMMC415 TaxID=2675222 RepID=UPI0012B4491C|nr:PQQ-binding-like beta-propeller repeat protein [Micromonospora sp. WMMC415]QGN47399.1 PQQ-binding-like beta-propeller repeat protein [Micromonospora sp. WMMC415]